ncbi:PAS domain-containing protein [Streptomyces sp. NPDC046887]|uniref:PAS domain-containing protein n=1 Tax=Streptomyces sp. NPDC046887 TaxID=3155472 RepID=UPI0033DA6D91
MSSRPSRGAARLAAILDALPDGLVLVNCNGTVVNANTIALEMFEAPGTALVGRGLLDLLPAFDSRLIPGSMRRPEAADARGRTKPARMVARRTDGGEFPVEVTSASLEDGREAYDPYSAGAGSSYTGDELLMLVVRDLSGTIDTEAELARSQRQTEMILRAAAEGVVGTDTDGRVVLVNPAAAQILGWRASDLGGKELHPLMLHSRADGEPFPYEESPLADTLRSGRKHRVRGQVVWAKDGSPVPVDLTTAPVRDGDQLVGAVMTFTDRRPYEELVAQHEEKVAEVEARIAELTERHTAELAELTERHTAEVAELAERHVTEVADRSERDAVERERREEAYAALAARHTQLTAVLGASLRGPLEELRGELGTLAADPAGQLWPEANQVLHHLAAGYARMTTLVDNVLGYQRLDAGAEPLHKGVALLDGVVAAGVEGAVELIGPGRVQFAVHAPPIEAVVDGVRLSTALAHLIADVAGVDSTGRTRQVAAGGYADSTIVVAAAQRGDVVRIEVRGPYAGGDPVHEPIVCGIVRAHGGVVQSHEVPGMPGSAFVLEVPLGEVDRARDGYAGGAAFAAAGALLPAQQNGERDAVGRRGGPDGRDGRGSVGVRDSLGGADSSGGPDSSGGQDSSGGPDSSGGQGGDTAGGGGVAPAAGAAGGTDGGTSGGGTNGGGRRRARRSSTDAFLESPVRDEDPVAAEPTGRRRARTDEAAAAGGAAPDPVAAAMVPAAPTGRRRGRPSPAEGAVLTAAESAQGRPALGETVPPQGVPADAMPVHPSGRRARRDGEPAALPALPAAPAAGGSANEPTGRRARRALGPAQERTATAEAGSSDAAAPRSPFALPPADADRRAPADAVHTDPSSVPAVSGVSALSSVPSASGVSSVSGSDEEPTRHDSADAEHGRGSLPTEPQPYQRNGAPRSAQAHPAPAPDPDAASAPTGRRRAVGEGVSRTADAAGGPAANGSAPEADSTAAGGGTGGGTGSVPLPPEAPTGTAADTGGPVPSDRPAPARRSLAEQPAGQPPSASAQDPSQSTQGRAFSVRTLGQGVPFTQQTGGQAAAGGQPVVGQQAVRPGATGTGEGSAGPQAAGQQATAGQGASSGSGRRRKLATPPEEDPAPVLEAAAAARPHPHPQPQPRLASSTGGRAYEIGAPDQDAAEGPELLDGPGGAVEVANEPTPQPVDDELPPEPLDNPRRLLVWPAPDVSTQEALSERGYRPVIVHSREEVDAQIAAFPAALFVDPLTGPITRTALQSLRQAAVAAEVPVLLAAGLGQATREAAYGADPAVLLKALAPRDSEQHPSRVLLIEEQEEIALALTASLERRGMQVARAATDSEAVTLAAQTRPNLVVMDLMQVRRRRAGIIDWLRANGQLNRTPLVVYTSASLQETELPKLSSGETVLFLAERSTSGEVQARIVDLLAKIGTN